MTSDIYLSPGVIKRNRILNINFPLSVIGALFPRFLLLRGNTLITETGLILLESGRKQSII